mmetsp:Transcript_10104/g.24308  ORF Transcript_10104/g.24308 Transcript_10104/m.24308 type:complete len:218 (-) Transcript_10104:282-935(-)
MLADIAWLGVWAACAFVPVDTRGAGFPSREGWEPLFCSVLQPLIGLFVFASSCPGGEGSVFAKVCRHRIMQGLGEYSFQVYLWHWPLGMLFKGAEIAITGDTSVGMAAPFLVPYLLASWLLAAAVSIYWEEPFRKWLRVHVDAWAARSEAEAERRLGGTVDEGKAGGSALLLADAVRSDGAAGPNGPTDNRIPSHLGEQPVSTVGAAEAAAAPAAAR